MSTPRHAITRIPKNAQRPRLSLVLCARNDQYQGNSRWRLETALNYLGQSVHQLGRERDVEVIVADWGSEIPLQNVLQLSTEAADIVSFLHIRPDIARLEQKDSGFPEVLAINAAARRAKGEYIGRIDQDTLVGRDFLDIFFWLNEKPRMLIPLERAVMVSNRRGIPYRFAVRCPPFWMVDRYLRWFGRSLPLMDPPPPHLPYQVYVGILLLHRDLWQNCGGYDESFIYMDFMEFDIIFRLCMKYPFLDIGDIVDYDFYHLDHYHPLRPLRMGRDRKSNPVRGPDNPPPRFAPNGRNWGLAQYSLRVTPYALDGARAGKHVPPPPGLALLNLLGILPITGFEMMWDRSIILAKRIVRSTLNKVGKGGKGLGPRDPVSGEVLRNWPPRLLDHWQRRRFGKP